MTAENSPFVSIVIPVYNCESYLQQCLESVLGQTEQDFEVICVDNCSTDHSPALLEEIASGDARVTVLCETRQGVSYARNTGIEHASGTYVVFVDADDYVELHFLERLRQASHSGDAQVVVYGMDDYYAGQNLFLERVGKIEEEYYQRLFRLSDLKGLSTAMMTPNVTTMMVSRSFINENAIRFPLDIGTSEDLVFVYRVLFAAQRIALIHECFYHYRRDPVTSLTHNDRGIDGLVALDYLQREMEEHVEDDPALLRQFVNLVLDTLEYQLGSSSGPAEFNRLFYGWQNKWCAFALEHEDLIDERYRPFFERAKACIPAQYVFSLYRDCYVRAEGCYHREVKMWHNLTDCQRELEECRRELEACRRERDEATRRLDETLSSRTFRAGKAVAFVPSKLRQAVSSRKGARRESGESEQ